MADELDAVDFGEEFESFAVGLRPVTARQIDSDKAPDDPERVVTCVDGIMATGPLVRRRRPDGNLPADATEFVLRANRLGWLPSDADELVDAQGVVWVVQSAQLEAFDTLVRLTVVIKRG